MPRLNPIDPNAVDPAASELLGSVKKKLGRVPNLIATMANSTAVAEAWLGFSGSLAGGSLPPRLREQIALVVGEANRCEYCLAAHTALGKRAGLSEQETLAARRASSLNPTERAALDFARKLVDNRGVVADGDVDELRRAGYSDGQLAEIVAHVALNLFTNYFNHVAGTEVDFPAATRLAAA